MLWLRRPSPPEPGHLTLARPDGLLTVDLRRRAAARRMTLRVSSATGAVTLTLPARADLASARTFLDAHAGWIATRLARVPVPVPFGPGAILPFRGEPHRIVHTSSPRAPTRARTEEGGAAIIAVSGDEAGLPGRVRRFLQAEAKADLGRAVLRYTEALGVGARRVTLRDTRSRWGSCSSAGALSFSWRLILAPPEVLDYLAAHEVAHLKELNHSHRFWALLRAMCPGTDAAEAWLKRHGNGLHRYG